MNAKPKRAAAELRERAQGAPRPGGRAAAHTGRSGQAARAERAYPTQGNAALAPQDTSPVPDRPTDRLPWLKVAPPMPVSVPRAPFILLLLFVVVGGVLGILLVNTKINENAFQLKDLQRQQAALDRQEQDLHKKIADYESPNNLAAAARRLGLVPAGSPAFIRLPDGRVIGVPRPAGGAPSLASGEDRATGR
jgi:cell division protein FtsB